MKRRLEPLALLFVLASLGCQEGGAKGGDDAGTDGDTDSDTDSDTDIDSDTDTDECWEDGWARVHPPLTTNDLNNVWGAGDEIFAVGDSGTILHFDGAEWNEMDSGTDLRLYGVWGSAVDDVYAAVRTGSDGDPSLLRFDGDAWAPVELNGAPAMFDVWGAAADDVWAVGWDGAIAHYDGADWTLEIVDATASFDRVWGSGTDDVYAVGWRTWNEGVMFHKDGTGWSEVLGSEFPILVDVWGSGPDDVWVVAGYQVWHRDESGWARLSDVPTASFAAVRGDGLGNVWFAGAWGAVWLYDGAEWTEVALADTDALRGLWGAGEDIVAVGDGGAILRHEADVWSADNGLTNTFLDSVWGSGTDDVFAVGEGGVILRGSGGDWERMDNPLWEQAPWSANWSSSSLFAVWGDSGDSVYAGGGWVVPKFLRFDGSSWSVDPIDAKMLLDGCMLDGAVGIFASQQPAAYPYGEARVETYDGTSWTELTVQPPMRVYQVWGAHAADLFAAGATGPNTDATSILQFDGAVWSEVVPDFGDYVSEIFGNSGDDVYALGWNGAVLHFDGVDWTQLRAEDDLALGSTWHDIWASGPGDVFIVQPDSIEHYDGSSWTEVYAGLHSMRAIWGSAPDDVFVVGGSPDGVVLHYDGVSFEPQDIGDASILHDVSGSAADDVTAVGANGAILYYDGSVWDPEPIGTGDDLTDVVVDVSGTAAAYRLHGTAAWRASDTWSVVADGLHCLAVLDIWSSGPEDVFATCGESILHRDAEGWSEMYVAPSMSVVRGVWGSAADEVFAVGNSGGVLFYDGESWSEIDVGTSAFLTAVWGSGPNDVFIVGDGVVVHYDGAWSVESVPAEFEDVYGFGPDHVFAVGRGDDGAQIVWHYDGAEWSPVFEDLDYRPNSVWGSSVDDLYIVGEGGLILHTECE